MTALIPFIFLTAKQEKTDIRYGMELGADDTLPNHLAGRSCRMPFRAAGRRELLSDYNDQRVRNLRYNLLRMLPHELTPLVGILGIGELLKQDAAFLTPPEIIEYAKMITSSGQHLYRLVENHLLYAQLEIYADDPQLLGKLSEGVVEEVASILRDTSTTVAKTYGRIDDLRVHVQPGAVEITRKHLA